MREAEERGAEGELAHLARDGVDDVLAPVAAVHVPQGREAVDKRAALGVVEVDALAADEDARAVLGVLLEGRRRVEEVSAVERGEPLDLLVGERQTRRHAASSERYLSTARRLASTPNGGSRPWTPASPRPRSRAHRRTSGRPRPTDRDRSGPREAIPGRTRRSSGGVSRSRR